MSTLNQLVSQYTDQLRKGKLQAAYKAILEYLGRLRIELLNKHPDYEVSGNIYQGYMDMSYFSLNTKHLKQKGLKIAIVYLHEKGTFEIWLSARNREIIKRYKTVFEGLVLDGMSVFHDADNEDAVLEYTLISQPDFDNQTLLTKRIEAGTVKFISAVIQCIQDNN